MDRGAGALLVDVGLDVRHDTEVPLVFYGKGAGMQRVNRRVDMTAVAPTLARLAGIREPAASEGEVLEEIVDL